MDESPEVCRSRVKSSPAWGLHGPPRGLVHWPGQPLRPERDQHAGLREQEGGLASPGGWSGSQYDMMSSQEAARSGQIQDTPLNKIQHKFWVTKQAVARKLGKEEDQHVVASD